jgi:hypothetical protein
MDRKAQIEFLDGNDSRVRSYVSKWLENPAVCDAVERRPAEVQCDGPPLIEQRRKIG